MENHSNQPNRPFQPRKPRKITLRYILISIGALFIIIAGIGLYVVSCEKETDTGPTTGKMIEGTETEDTTQSKPQASAARAENLLYEETCESGAFFATAHSRENNGSAYTASYVTAPVFQGLKSARFEIRKDMVKVGSAQSYRSEVVIIKGDAYPNFPRDIWYSYALLIPSKGQETDTYRDCITQWYEDGTDETTVRIERGKAFLEVCPPAGETKLMKYDLFGTGSTQSTSGLSTLNEIPKDEWHEFVYHFIHSMGSDGLIEVWRDGVKIHTIKGRNMHLKLPKWKLGLYKSSMGSSSLYSRVIFFDNVRVGNTSSTLATMVSGAVTGAPTPVPPITTEPVPPTQPTAPTAPVAPIPGQQITGFEIVNAIIDKPIGALPEGAVIDMKAAKLEKINIKANAVAGVGSIKFELTGPQSKSRVDGKVPFAALGDDGSGNYYSWIPAPGKYTLKATPYATTNGSGPAGPVTTLTFTIK